MNSFSHVALRCPRFFDLPLRLGSKVLNHGLKVLSNREADSWTTLPAHSFSPPLPANRLSQSLVRLYLLAT
jgi:hypothetical protein